MTYITISYFEGLNYDIVEYSSNKNVLRLNLTQCTQNTHEKDAKTFDSRFGLSVEFKIFLLTEYVMTIREIKYFLYY